MARGRLLFEEVLLGFTIHLHRSVLIHVVGPMALAIHRLIRNLYVRLVMICKAQNVGRPLRLGTSRTTTTQEVNRRVLIIANNGRQDVTTRLRRQYTMEPTHVRRQFLRGILRRSLLYNTRLIRLIGVSRHRSVRT